MPRGAIRDLGAPLEDTLISAAIWFVFTAVAWHFDARRQRKTAAKLADQDGSLVYVRYPDARPGSLSGIWNMGVAPFSEAGAMKFQPAVYDTLVPSGRPTTFKVLAPASTDPREINRHERQYATTRASEPSVWPPTKVSLKWPRRRSLSGRSST
jgi:hypothetical protein